MKPTRLALGALLGYAITTYAILPLPYPAEAPAESPMEIALPTKDPREIQGYMELSTLGKTREMELPHFESNSALGYDGPETFSVPKALQSRVNFWKSIYTEYTSRQAVLHDSEYPELVYGVVDLPSEDRPGESARKRQRRLNRFLKGEKDKIVGQLKQLHQLQATPTAIPDTLFPLFKKFEAIPGRDRFVTAIDRLRAQSGQRDRIVQGFVYGGRYFSQMMEIFEKRGVPKELTRLPLVESAFNLAARSKVGASGVWQFMRSTGEKFMRIDKAVDERNDPITAAWAAADLLRQNYEALGSWPLAITAYNHGREGMARAVRELETTNLAEIIRRYKVRNFGFASSNFYAEFLAILDVERDYRRHFGKLMTDAPIAYEEVNLGAEVHFTNLADTCGVRQEELAGLNPALTDWVLSGKGPVPVGYRLKVPVGRAENCQDTANVSQRESVHLEKAL